MFEVAKKLSRCQFGILNKGRGSNIKYLPFAFSELGVSMFSSVLNLLQFIVPPLVPAVVPPLVLLLPLYKSNK
jgi:hypothetical protein